MRFFFLLGLGFFSLQGYSLDYFDNLFESKDYIVLLRYSSIYSSYKLRLEKIIEGQNKKRLFISPSYLEKLASFNLKTIQLLDQLSSSYNDNIILSQIYQVKVEISLLDGIIEKTLSFYKRNGKYDYNDILKLEKAVYRIEIYLRGLSNRISDL